MVDFVEICNVCARKVIIKAVKRIINSDKVCRSYSDLNFGITFFGTQCIIRLIGYSKEYLKIHTPSPLHSLSLPACPSLSSPSPPLTVTFPLEVQVPFIPDRSGKRSKLHQQGLGRSPAEIDFGAF